MRSLLLQFGLLSALSLSAQNRCATPEYIQTIKSSDSKLARQITEAEIFTQGSGEVSTGITSSSFTNSLIRIPVVVHILYNNAAQNISDEQVKSQIDALNRDFRRKNSDSVNTPDRFKPVAADVSIEFYLATADIKGMATTGIVRKQTNVSYWTMDDKIKFSSQGGDDGWDSRYYLNIWVGNIGSLLGYSSVVGGAANKDGVVINSNAFGTFNVLPNYNKGRTTVHETGHWLGLKHIWGDTYCGDDGIADTPAQSGFTTGCPTGFRTSCSNGATGDMYMNYMDFTNDDCLNLFTIGQKEKMLHLFREGGPRYTFLFSKGLNQPWVEALPLPEQTTNISVATTINIYPNPASNQLLLDFGTDETWVGQIIYLINAQGVVVQTIKVSTKKESVSVAHLPSGVYFLQASKNGKHFTKKLVKL